MDSPAEAGRSHAGRARLDVESDSVSEQGEAPRTREE